MTSVVKTPRRSEFEQAIDLLLFAREHRGRSFTSVCTACSINILQRSEMLDMLRQKFLMIHRSPYGHEHILGLTEEGSKWLKSAQHLLEVLQNPEVHT